MSEESFFETTLGSFTSGVDGSSEGGRVNTMRVPNALGLYGVALVNRLKEGGYRGQLSFRPVIFEGLWALELEYGGDPPPAPQTWHGHRVVLAQKAPPAPEQK